MAFVFGRKSKENLKGVHPLLVKIATRALELSPIDFRVSWDFSHYRTIAGCFKQAAEEIGTESGVTCTWGGDWATLRDGPHFQIDVKKD